MKYGRQTRPRKHARQTTPLLLEKERNVPNVRERFHGVLFASASGDSAHFVPSGGWLHALRLTFAKTITGAGGDCAVFTRHFALDAARVSHSPIHLSLRTHVADRNTVALHNPRRSPRLSKRRKETRHAPEHQRSAPSSFLRRFSSNFRTSDPVPFCRAGFRLRLLRHASLRLASFSHETRRLALA